MYTGSKCQAKPEGTFSPGPDDDIMALADEFILYEEPVFDFLDYLYGARITPIDSHEGQPTTTWKADKNQRKPNQAESLSLNRSNQSRFRPTESVNLVDKAQAYEQNQNAGVENSRLQKLRTQNQKTESRKPRLLSRNNSINAAGYTPYQTIEIANKNKKIQPSKLVLENKRILGHSKSIDRNTNYQFKN